MMSVLAVLLLQLLRYASALECMSCSVIQDPGMCPNVVDCQTSCYINRFPSVQLQQLYSVGCDTSGLICNSGGGLQIIGKRQVKNTACCQTDNCNEDISLLTVLPVTPLPTLPSQGTTDLPWPVVTVTPPPSSSGSPTTPISVCQDTQGATYCKNMVNSFGSVEACADSSIQAGCQNTCGMCGKSGTLFFVDFMKMDGNKGAHIELLMVGTQTGTVDINIPYLNITKTIPLPLGMTKYQVPKTILPTNLHVEKKGIEVISSVPMTLFAINMEAANSDGYSVIPVNKLGTEYFVPSTVGENEMTIVSPYDMNSVSITMKMPRGDVTVNNTDYGNGDTFNVVLDKFDTLEVNAYDPYAGTKIVSSKPIALVSGDRCTGLEGVGCDHLLDMIPPTKSYSMYFIIPKLVDRKNSTVQIIASEGNTDVNVNEISSGRITNKNLANPGDHLDITVADLGVITASKKVLVTMFVHACCAPLYHEPFMMVVPGIDRFLPEYHLAVWDGGNRFQNHLTVVIPQGNEKGLLLDGRPVVPYTKEYTVNVNGVTYSVFGILTNEGAHQMLHNKGVNFGLFVHGNTASNGYGYAAGMKMD